MIRGCLKLVLGVAVLAGIAVFGWMNRERIRGWIDERRGIDVASTRPEPAPTPEMADEADRKLRALANGETPRVAFTELELQSLLRFRYAQLLPAFVDSPRVELEGSLLRLRADVPVDKLPRVSDLGEAAALLPDTAELVVSGQVLELEDGRVALAVDEVTAARIPLPKRLVPPALERLGRRDEPGLAPNAVALPLPPGIGAAFIRGDSLFLLARSAGQGN
jgi:hypothetical protein